MTQYRIKILDNAPAYRWYGGHIGGEFNAILHPEYEMEFKILDTSSGFRVHNEHCAILYKTKQIGTA